MWFHVQSLHAIFACNTMLESLQLLKRVACKKLHATIEHETTALLVCDKPR